MNLVKRFTTTVATSFDWMISQVENHEALVNSALSEMQQASAKARVQLGRVQKDGQNMKNRLLQLADIERTWAERAIKTSATDEKTALECVKRRNQARRDAAALETQISEHQRLEKQLTADLKTIEDRIADLRRKKNAFSARQYRAEALRTAQPEEIGMMQGIDDLFDRWESRLAQCEVFSTTTVDTFEEQFVSQEEEQTLRAELSALVADKA